MDDGLRIETAVGVMARDMIRKHLEASAFTIRVNRRTGQDAVAAYVDGLAAVMALTITGDHGSKDDVINATVTKLREAVDRDLRHLKP